MPNPERRQTVELALLEAIEAVAVRAKNIADPSVGPRYAEAAKELSEALYNVVNSGRSK